MVYLEAGKLQSYPLFFYLKSGQLSCMPGTICPDAFWKGLTASCQRFCENSRRITYRKSLWSVLMGQISVRSIIPTFYEEWCNPRKRAFARNTSLYIKLMSVQTVTCQPAPFSSYLIIHTESMKKFRKSADFS